MWFFFFKSKLKWIFPDKTKRCARLHLMLHEVAKRCWINDMRLSLAYFHKSMYVTLSEANVWKRLGGCSTMSWCGFDFSPHWKDQYALVWNTRLSLSVRMTRFVSPRAHQHRNPHTHTQTHSHTQSPGELSLLFTHADAHIKMCMKFRRTHRHTYTLSLSTSPSIFGDSEGARGNVSVGGRSASVSTDRYNYRRGL